MLAFVGYANEALILIRSDRINHAIKPDQYAHGTWVKWPLPWDSSGANLYMSPLSGHDWKGTASDLAFKENEAGQIVALNAASLEERGYNEARRQVVGPQSPLLVLRDDGGQSAEAMLIAVGYDGKVQTVSKHAEYPAGRLLVYDALNWDDAAEVAARAGGRVVVLEYPPTSDTRLTPIWLLKGRWPPGLPHEEIGQMPGLLNVRDIGGLLYKPERLKWSDSAQPRWKGAGYWYREIGLQQFGFELGLGILAAVAGVLGAFFVAHERRSHITRFLLLGTFFAVPAAGLAGYFGEARGPSAVLPATVGLWVVLTAIATLVSWAGGQKRLVWLSLFAFAAIRHGYFEFSLLGQNDHIPMGGFLAGAAGVAGFSAGTGIKWRITFVSLGVLVLGAGTVENRWWTIDLSTALVLPIVVLGAAGLTRIAVGGAAALASLTLAQHGFRFALNSLGRIGALRDTNAVDLGQPARFLISPLVLTMTLLALGSLALGGRFFWHELKKLTKADPRRLSVVIGGLLTLVVGLALPQWLLTGAVVTLAGLLLFLYDCVGEL